MGLARSNHKLCKYGYLTVSGCFMTRPINANHMMGYWAQIKISVNPLKCLAKQIDTSHTSLGRLRMVMVLHLTLSLSVAANLCFHLLKRAHSSFSWLIKLNG